MDDPNVTYKSAFAALQERLGRVPTVHDPEWLAIGNEYSRSYEEEKRGKVEPEANSRRVVRPGYRKGDNARGVDRRPAQASNPAVPEEPSGLGQEDGRAGVVSSGDGPGETEFSRQPAPQAHTGGEEVNMAKCPSCGHLNSYGPDGCMAFGCHCGPDHQWPDPLFPGAPPVPSYVAPEREAPRICPRCGTDRYAGDLLSVSCPVCAWRPNDEEPLSGPGAAQPREEAQSEPGGGNGAPGDCQTAIKGSPLDIYGHRGPNGGVIAECRACRRLWERPARRGRPSSVCEECR